MHFKCCNTRRSHIEHSHVFRQFAIFFLFPFFFFVFSFAAAQRHQRRHNWRQITGQDVRRGEKMRFSCIIIVIRGIECVCACGCVDVCVWEWWSCTRNARTSKRHLFQAPEKWFQRFGMFIASRKTAKRKRFLPPFRFVWRSHWTTSSMQCAQHT